MSTFKKTKVVLLTTNEKASSLSVLNSGKLNYGAEAMSSINTKLQHLYFLSDEEIKEGDWVYNGTAIWQVKSYYGFQPIAKKIIATTDKNLKIITGKVGSGSGELLPQPSQLFIEKFVDEYNKGNVITEVMVEYNEPITEIPKSYKHYSEVELLDDTLKVNRDNTITIRKVKDSWSTEEMRQKLNDYRLYAKNSNLSIEMFDKWIEENL